MKLLRIGLASGTLALLCACSGNGGSGSIFNPFPGGGNTSQSCDPGTSVQIARPSPGSFASNVGNIEIVASGNNNTLGQTYQSWNVSVVNQYNGQTATGNNLTPVSDTSGPHPFTSDYFYSSALNQTLPSGNTWTVYLNDNNYTGFNGYCNAYPIGNFST